MNDIDISENGKSSICDKDRVKRGLWSPEEDAIIKSYIENNQYDLGCWYSLPQKAGLIRCGKSCRLRWLNYLRPNLKLGGYTEEEDNIICSIYHKYGRRQQLPDYILLKLKLGVQLSKILSKKRGLSLEEKREKMLQIFYDSQSFYLLGPKKGVITQSVKDVVQSLVDDDLVSKDKIGTSVYFWSLPSCAGNQLRNVSRKLDSDLQSSKKRHAELVDQCNALKKGREESDEREEALEELKAIELKYNELKDEMGQYADNDPAAFEAMRNAIEVAHAAANRWTDNIFTLRQWCSSNFPHAKEQLEHVYFEAGITDDLDYLESSPVPLSAVVDQIPESSP
ncbi:hypothetical protein Dsin_015281 [Dipteronia sinensis]|uniref:Uncharacterized protein n=1 Tax=Dipteronia sinensis TaxID=43782 RepID=A0AAE0E4V8_9ROSI|nr:hypothetical protein Dsin_015281 [Dipteronia sinensis]